MLSEARESLGLSVADVAAMTRIPKAMLKYLESDRYDEYSAEVFARGHLRNYAREVQLEPELVLKAFDRYRGNLDETAQLQEELEDDPEAPAEVDRSEVGEPWFDWDLDEITRHVQPAHLVAVGLVVAALFVVFGILAFSGQRATAQKTTDFPEGAGTATDDWEHKDESEESRWLLEQSPGDSERDSSD